MSLSRNTGAILLDNLNTLWFPLQVTKEWSLIPVSHWISNRLSPSDVRLVSWMWKVESAIHSQLKWLWCVIIGSSIDWQWWKHDNWMDKHFFALLPAQCYDTCWGTIHWRVFHIMTLSLISMQLSAVFLVHLCTICGLLRSVYYTMQYAIPYIVDVETEMLLIMEISNATGITNKIQLISIVSVARTQNLDNLTVLSLFAVLFTFIIST